MSTLDELYPVDCQFCAIAKSYPPPSCSTDVIPSGPSLEPDAPEAWLLLNTPKVLAFLDHAPISRGHLLVIVRNHRQKLSDLHIGEAQALGAWLGVLSRTVIGTVAENGGTHELLKDDVGDWNVVQNNGARAAQVVPHVHFHIIPRSGAVPEVKARSWTIFGRGQREDLDDDDAKDLIAQLRTRLSRELDRLKQREGQAALDFLIGVQNSIESKL